MCVSYEEVCVCVYVYVCISSCTCAFSAHKNDCNVTSTLFSNIRLLNVKSWRKLRLISSMMAFCATSRLSVCVCVSVSVSVSVS